MKISDDIHNYYEKLMLEQFVKMNVDEKYDIDFIADLSCIILNQLPARYIRHEVDMAFYLPAPERYQMETKVKEAIEKALTFMTEHRAKNDVVLG